MLSRGSLAIIKIAGEKIVYVDYCRGKIGNLPKIKVNEKEFSKLMFSLRD